MGYFEIKQQLSQRSSTPSSSGYFALKEKALPTIEALRFQRQKQQAERAKQEKNEQINANIEKYKQEAKETSSLWGLAKNTVKGVGSTLLGFGKELLRAPATIPLKVVQSITEAATGKPQVYTPQTGVEKFIYGDTRQSYQQDQAGITKWGQEKGLGTGTSTALGVAGAGAEVALDLGIPGAGSTIVKASKNIFRRLKPGELAPVVKEVEEQVGKKLKPSEALKVKDDLESGLTKEEIIEKNKVPEAPQTPKIAPQEAFEPKKVEIPTPKAETKTPLIQGEKVISEGEKEIYRLSNGNRVEINQVKLDRGIWGLEYRTGPFEQFKISKETDPKKIIDFLNNKSQPLQEGVELTPSKVAQSIEAKAVEEKLTKGFIDIAGYEKITIKEQAEKATKLLNEEYDNAVKMVKGEIPMKEGLKPEMLIKTMEDLAQSRGDVELLRSIAKSPLVSETSAHAQALRILAERNPESAVANIQKVAKERAATFEKKTGKSISKATKEIADEIKTKAKQKIPTRDDWNKFIEEIKC